MFGFAFAARGQGAHNMARVTVNAERSRVKKQLGEARKELKEKEEAMARESNAAEEQWNQERCEQGEILVPSKLVRCSRRHLVQLTLSTVVYSQLGSDRCLLCRRESGKP